MVRTNFLGMRGLIIGKFNPPHLGHYHLISTALSQVDHLDVLITTWKDEDIPAKQRADWLRRDHPSIHTHLLDQDAFDRNQAENWITATHALIPQAPDLVFSSEDYGELYAKLLGARHVMVDRERVTIPCSASLIRSDPSNYLHFLPALVRQYFEENPFQ